MLMQKSYAQTQTEIQLQWIFNIAHGTQWLNEDTISTFKIGVFGGASMFRNVQKFAQRHKLKSKKVEVIRFKRVKDISYTQILYLPNAENYYLQEVYSQIKGKNTLFFTEKAQNKQFTVINFLSGADNQKHFVINTKNTAEQELILSKTLLKIGGTESDLRNLYSQTEKQLQAKQRKLEEQKRQLNRLATQLNLKEQKIKKQQLEINTKQALVDTKETALILQQANLDSLKLELEAQKRVLEQSKTILIEKETIINAQKDAFEQQKLEKDRIQKDNIKADEELKSKQARIKEIDARLNESNDTVETQKGVIYIFIGFIVIILVLIVFSVMANQKKKQANILLEKQKAELHLQKEEIQAQTKQLESANTELEKLSIVASKTDNAVTIMDADGNFEWINAGYTRLFGYTFQLLTHELDENIKYISGNDKIKDIVNKCISTKETMFYENKSLTRSGKSLWVQTTLTPILDENENVIKLVSIDTDISKQKEAEEEIRQQSEELITQKDELKIQNAEIEEQHSSIQSSIRYAKSIQNSILPLHENIREFLNMFILFMPKDIVSGDFYWFAHLPAKDGLSEKIFIAAVDCTGHGVPGAFMSLIGNRLLNEIVLEKKIVAPREILKELDVGIIKALRQQIRDNNDGMDVCLARIEFFENGEQKLKFSGAKRPLFYYPKGATEIKILHADRKSIGGTQMKRSNIQFTDQEIDLNPGDKVWLSTDGFIDQNNKARKRFGTPRFAKLLESTAEYSLQIQENKLLTSLINYQDDQLQRDDITVIGLEIKENPTKQ